MSTYLREDESVNETGKDQIMEDAVPTGPPGQPGSPCIRGSAQRVTRSTSYLRSSSYWHGSPCPATPTRGPAMAGKSPMRDVLPIQKDSIGLSEAVSDLLRIMAA